MTCYSSQQLVRICLFIESLALCFYYFFVVNCTRKGRPQGLKEIQPNALTKIAISGLLTYAGKLFNLIKI